MVSSSSNNMLLVPQHTICDAGVLVRRFIDISTETELQLGARVIHTPVSSMVLRLSAEATMHLSLIAPNNICVVRPNENTVA